MKIRGQKTYLDSSIYVLFDDKPAFFLWQLYWRSALISLLVCFIGLALGSNPLATYGGLTEPILASTIYIANIILPNGIFQLIEWKRRSVHQFVWKQFGKLLCIGLFFIFPIRIICLFVFGPSIFTEENLTYVALFCIAYPLLVSLCWSYVALSLTIKHSFKIAEEKHSKALEEEIPKADYYFDYFEVLDTSKLVFFNEQHQRRTLNFLSKQIKKATLYQAYIPCYYKLKCEPLDYYYYSVRLINAIRDEHFLKDYIKRFHLHAFWHLLVAPFDTRQHLQWLKANIQAKSYRPWYYELLQQVTDGKTPDHELIRLAEQYKNLLKQMPVFRVPLRRVKDCEVAVFNPLVKLVCHDLLKSKGSKVAAEYTRKIQGDFGLTYKQWLISITTIA